MKLTKSQLRRLIEEEIKLISEARISHPMEHEPIEPLKGLPYAQKIAKSLKMAVETEFFDPIEHEKLLLTLIDLVLKLE